MKKSLTGLILCITMLASLVACGAKEAGNSDVTNTTPTAGVTAPAATTAPAAEEPEESEKQPEATEIPEVTKAPTSPKDFKASLAEGDITLKMDELSFVKAPRAEYTMQEDGSVDVRFKQKDNSEIRFLLPARIDLNECSGITVRMRADYDVKCMLLNNSVMWSKDCTAFYEEYTDAEGVIKEYYFTPDKADEVYGISFAPAQEIDDYALYKATIYSVTFHTKGTEEVTGNGSQETTAKPTENPRVTGIAKPTPTPMVLEGKKLIAITVDDGTDGEGTESYLKLAKKYNIPLTFFVVGSWSENHPEQLQEILDAGCEIGNHTANHEYLTELSEAGIKKEINDAISIVRKYAPDAQMKFVRAPYLAYNDTVFNTVKYPLIDAKLLESYTDYEESLELLLNAEDGDIMMLHVWNKMSLQALEEAIPLLEKKGFAFVTISQLFEAQGVEPQPGTVYRSVRKKSPHPKADVTKGDICYSIDELKVMFSEGVKYTEKAGSMKLQFDKAYGQIRLLLPAAIDTSQCTGISIKMKAKDTWIGVTYYDDGFVEHPTENETELFANFVEIRDEVEEQGFYVPDIGYVYGIALTHYGDENTQGAYEAVIESITFHMLSGNTVSIPYNIAPDVTEDMTLMNTYGTVLDKMGTQVFVAGLKNPAVVQELKKHYNSVVLCEGTYLDMIVPNPIEAITVEEARKLGYIIPDNYREKIVPKMDFEQLDEILKICAENDLMFRFHCLMWHDTEYDYFYRSDYKESGALVSQEVMDARLEFYVRTVMEHVYGGEYGDVVCDWIVMNEYLKASTPESNCIKIYGDQGLEPEYLKLIYTVADDVLKKYGVRDKVALIFNEYDTYFVDHTGRDMTQDILSVLEYINSDGMVCDTIGMQSHLDTTIPIKGKMKKAVQAFLDAGYAVQISELDVTISTSEAGKESQEKYYCEVMEMLLEFARKGEKITGLTFWGASDNISWLKEYDPLMFTHLGRPKDAYYKVLQTYLNPERIPEKETVDITYGCDELQYRLSYVGDYTINQDGSMNVAFQDQYQEIMFQLPEAIDMKQCVGITVKAKSEYSDLAVKLYGADWLTEPISNPMYQYNGCLGEGVLDYDKLLEKEETVYGIGFMALHKVEDFSKYKATVYSVTFHMEPGYKK